MSYQSHYSQEVRKAQQRTYIPYSHFKIGAYLKTRDGRHFYGANVENAAYPATTCAERLSLVAAISGGCRPGDFEPIAVTVDAEHPSSPCETCRQILKELYDDDMPMYVTDHKGEMIKSAVVELLPHGFSRKDLE